VLGKDRAVACLLCTIVLAAVGAPTWGWALCLALAALTMFGRSDP